MRPPNSQDEIESLKLQIHHKEKMLDIALKKDVELFEAKKILHEIRELKERLQSLVEQKQN